MLKTILVLLCFGLLTGCTTNSSSHTSNDIAKTKTNTVITTEVASTPMTKESINDRQKNKTISSEEGKDISSFVPDGWHILERVKGKPEKIEGDLNKDGINDIAFVIEGISKTKEEAPPRVLLIAFGTKDHTYILSVKAEHAILRSDEGGVWPDPFTKISIDRGSIIIDFYGGSNYRWYGKYRFRYQDNDWYLIGATIGSYFTGTTTQENADEDDYNLLTGDIITRKTDEKDRNSSHTTKR